MNPKEQLDEMDIGDIIDYVLDNAFDEVREAVMESLQS